MEENKLYLEENKSNRKVIKRVALTTLIWSIALAAAQLAFGAWFGSLSVVSDALHSFTDAATTVLVLLAVAIAKPAADKDHHYGHEKREPLLVLFFALILAGVGVYLAVQGIRGLIFPKPAEINYYLIGITALLIVSKEGMYWYAAIWAKRIKSDMLKADAWHHRSDSLSSIAILAGLLSGFVLSMDWVENAAVLLVAALIIWVAVKILKSSIDKLTDKAAPAEIQAGILKLIAEVEGVITVDKLQTRLFGHGFFADVEIGVDGSLSVDESHKIAETVHDRLETQKLYPIKHCNVHVNPAKIPDSNTPSAD